MGPHVRGFWGKENVYVFWKSLFMIVEFHDDNASCNNITESSFAFL